MRPDRHRRDDIAVTAPMARLAQPDFGAAASFASHCGLRSVFAFASLKPRRTRFVLTASGVAPPRVAAARRMGGAQRVREYAPDDKLRDTHQLRLGLNPSCRTLLAERARRKEIPEPDQADSSSPALFEKIFRFSPTPNHL